MIQLMYTGKVLELRIRLKFCFQTPTTMMIGCDVRRIKLTKWFIPYTPFSSNLQCRQKKICMINNFIFCQIWSVFKSEGRHCTIVHVNPGSWSTIMHLVFWISYNEIGMEQDRDIFVKSPANKVMGGGGVTSSIYL